MTSSALTGNTSGLASATSPGLVGITTQTFAGVKTFQDGLAFTSASLSDVQATILGLKQYLHGTTYNGGNAPTVTSALAGFAVTRAIFVPYQCQDSSWRLKINVVGSFTSATVANTTITINGLVFKNITNFYQACSGWLNGTASTYLSVYTNFNANTVALNVGSSVATVLSVSGDVELNAKPTWAY